MLKKIFRTKESKIIAIIATFIIVVISLIFVCNYVNRKKFLEQAVMAENYLSAGKYEQAVEAYKKVLSMKRSDKRMFTIDLAEAYVGLNDYDEALEILRSYYMKSPDTKIKEKIEDITARKTDYEYQESISKAELFFSKKEYEKAISEFEKAKEIKSKDVTSYKRIAEAYILLGEYEKAREEVIEGQEITGDDKLTHTLALVNSYLYKEKYESLMQEASEYILQENYADGEKKYRDAINLLPNESAAYIELANIYIMQEKYNDAILLLSQINKYFEDQELTEVYNRAKELKEVDEEKNNILKLLINAFKNRDFNAVVTIMRSPFFIENIVDETDVYYNLNGGTSAQYNDDETEKLVNGVNLVVYDKNETYYGNLLNGTRKGTGIYITLSGNKKKKYSYYEGRWDKNLPNGDGNYVEVELYTDNEGNEHENKIKTNGKYVNGLEDGEMKKYFYLDDEETSHLSYLAKNGIPQSLPQNSTDSYPALEKGYYIIGEIYISDKPSGEYYSVKSGTIWGVSELIK